MEDLFKVVKVELINDRGWGDSDILFTHANESTTTLSWPEGVEQNTRIETTSACYEQALLATAELINAAWQRDNDGEILIETAYDLEAEICNILEERGTV